MRMSAEARIDIALELDRGRVARVEIAPRRLPPVSTLVVGRPAIAMVRLVPRLFTLCAVAHGVAVQTAVDAARGVEMSAALHRRRAAAVLVERLVEQLRATLTAMQLLQHAVVAAAMREVMRATAAFAPAGADAGGQRRAIDAIARALDRCNIASLTPPDDAAVARFGRSGASWLTADDDLAVIARLGRDGATFAHAPDLDGEVPETGAWARTCADSGRESAHETTAARLRARLDEVARMPQMLRELVEGDATADRVVAFHRLGAGRGAAAVETARGRLYHHVELDADGRVTGFYCLAPTEWNFHPNGPLARMLRGATLAGAAGEAAVERLIAVFDPCVGHRLVIREVADA
jgi:coenzyme F420-reducing hydrogenase alpha subunit